MSYKKIEIPYPYNNLEPYISEEIIKKHYEINHTSYQNKLNAAIEGKQIEDRFPILEDLMKNYQKIDDPETRIAIRQFGGGLLNHNFFFNSLKKDIYLSDGPLRNKIEYQYGSMEEFKMHFKREVLNLFGSGWVWFVRGKEGMLNVIKTFNQDTPHFLGFTPLFGIDVWEHAFIFQFQDNKSGYFDQIWKCIDWEFVQNQYLK